MIHISRPLIENSEMTATRLQISGCAFPSPVREVGRRVVENAWLRRALACRATGGKPPLRTAQPAVSSHAAMIEHHLPIERHLRQTSSAMTSTLGRLTNQAFAFPQGRPACRPGF